MVRCLKEFTVLLRLTLSKTVNRFPIFRKTRLKVGLVINGKDHMLPKVVQHLTENFDHRVLPARKREALTLITIKGNFLSSSGSMSKKNRE